MANYPFDVSWQRQIVSHGGNIFFVSSGLGNNANPGDTPAAPVATLAYALTLCTASRGDVVYLLPGHAETLTAGVTLSTAGVAVKGLGVGNNRPAFTGSGAINMFTLSAANCSLDNVRLVGATASVLAHLVVAAADLDITNCVFVQPATPTESVWLNAGANRFYFDRCRWIGTADGPDSAFFFNTGSGSITEWGVTNCRFNYLPNGLDNAVFLATVDACPGGIIQNCHAIGLDATCLFVDFNSSVSLAEGQIVECTAQARAAATVANLYDLGGYGMVRFAINDGPQRGALLHPATSST